MLPQTCSCPKQLSLNELDAFTWEKQTRKSLDSYSSQSKLQQLLDSPRTLQVQLRPHSTDGLKQTLKEVRDADT